MQTVDTQVNSCTLTGFNDFFFHLLAHFSHHFLNTCRVNTTVGHQLVKGKACNLTAHRIKTGKNDGFRSIVHNDFNTCSGFQSTDITSFATDDAALDFIAVNMENGYGIFDGRFRCHTLNGLNHNSFGFLIGCKFGFVHDVVDIGSSLSLGFVLQRFNEFFLGFFSRKTRNMLQHFLCLLVHLVHLVLANFDGSHLIVERILQSVGFVTLALQFRLHLVQLQFALLGFRLSRLHFRHPCVSLLFRLRLHFILRFLEFKELVFLHNVSFELRFLQNAVSA